ncbi:MAG: bifunctional aspartate kinase/diaminopimelate decarboxylase [Candidatus Schekmanbacteria bacterium]|nr:bifunctional aspartate kinase/diaminopimelate decarboxylase [Candidatus Schekmanbacteria bacterium]
MSASASRLTSKPWIVLKFGGTSVSSRARWDTIAAESRQRLAKGLRPLIVCSALSGVSNTLEKLLDVAVRDAGHAPIIDQLIAQHRALAADLALSFDDLLGEPFAELSRLALGISMLKEVSPRLHAQVMASGELLATRLGAAFLSANGLPCAWIDARSHLSAIDEPHGSARRRYLSATCGFDADPELQALLGSRPEPVLLTQGFIARGPNGDTVLLGRGGSDTSAAYFAARLQAVRCEIWTDVPGMFTADPHLIPGARLLRALGYGEAQEIASTGAKVLHPRCIAPVRQHAIPLHIRCTPRPTAEGTVISLEVPDAGAQVKSLSAKKGITLVSMETVGMWQQVGFLADSLACFKDLGLSVDLVSTSETNVTVSLDPTANALDPATIGELLVRLNKLCRASTIGPCAAISLVGRSIRAILHKLGPTLELFAEQRIHLVSQAASDLNLTFVVDEEQADRLIRELHHLLFHQRLDEAIFGPTHRELFDDGAAKVAPARRIWWRERAADLLAAAGTTCPGYYYDPGTLDEAVAAVRGIEAVDRIFFAIKANAFPPILRRFYTVGLGFECVSCGELELIASLFPGIAGERILFTPNFAAEEEYARAFALGARVTLDNVHPLEAWPELFAGSSVVLRVDLGVGRGHHAHVRTAGPSSKFGVSSDQLDRVCELADHLGTRIVGLHSHSGSGIRDPYHWRDQAVSLVEAARRFPLVSALNLGGGLAVPERPGDPALDLDIIATSLAQVKAANPRFELWMEPGRYLVSRAGVLLARVTQTKRKGTVTYIGVNTGMNSLIRPALYGAHHQIVNLTRLSEPPTLLASIVGPICESADTLGYDRRIAPSREGDIVLIATAGAYGRTMSSHYNLRPPAAEILLSESEQRGTWGVM